MRHRTVTFLATFLLLLTCLSSAEEQTTEPQPQEPSTPFQWNAGIDTYADRNFNDPASKSNALRNFDTQSNAFRLAAASIDLDYKTGFFGAHLTAGYGDLFRTVAAADRLKGVNSYATQYYVSYRPLKETALQFDVGKFYTSIGAEVPETQANFNYSRSLLFALGEPYYHFGFRATIPVTKTFTLGAQLVNGWNKVENSNGGMSVGVTTALTEAKWGWSQAIMIGPEKGSTTPSQRQVYNEVITLKPYSFLESYTELLYGRDKHIGYSSGSDSWYGLAVATRWKAAKKLSLSPRFEYYVDQTGSTSGIPQHLREATATAEYRVHPLVTTRLEYRDDFSNRKFFEHASDTPRRQQGTLTLAILLSARAER